MENGSKIMDAVLAAYCITNAKKGVSAKEAAERASKPFDLAPDQVELVEETLIEYLIGIESPHEIFSPIAFEPEMDIYDKAIVAMSKKELVSVNGHPCDPKKVKEAIRLDIYKQMCY